MPFHVIFVQDHELAFTVLADKEAGHAQGAFHHLVIVEPVAVYGQIAEDVTQHHVAWVFAVGHVADAHGQSHFQSRTSMLIFIARPALLRIQFIANRIASSVLFPS